MVNQDIVSLVTASLGMANQDTVSLGMVSRASQDTVNRASQDMVNRASLDMVNQASQDMVNRASLGTVNLGSRLQQPQRPLRSVPYLLPLWGLSMWEEA